MEFCHCQADDESWPWEFHEIKRFRGGFWGPTDQRLRPRLSKLVAPPGTEGARPLFLMDYGGKQTMAKSTIAKNHNVFLVLVQKEERG
jgi:hypothetical protein